VWIVYDGVSNSHQIYKGFPNYEGSVYVWHADMLYKLVNHHDCLI